MSESKTCPKCNGKMTTGRILKKNEYTLSQSYLYVFASHGEGGPRLGQAPAGTPTRKGLAAYCCEKCGFVEFYGVPLA